MLIRMSMPPQSRSASATIASRSFLLRDIERTNPNALRFGDRMDIEARQRVLSCREKDPALRFRQGAGNGEANARTGAREQYGLFGLHMDLSLYGSALTLEVPFEGRVRVPWDGCLLCCCLAWC